MGDVGLHNPNNTASHSEANELQQAVISAHKMAKSFSLSLSLILSLSGSLQHTLIMALHTNEYLKHINCYGLYHVTFLVMAVEKNKFDL